MSVEENNLTLNNFFLKFSEILKVSSDLCQLLINTRILLFIRNFGCFLLYGPKLLNYCMSCFLLKIQISPRWNYSQPMDSGIMIHFRKWRFFQKTSRCFFCFLVASDFPNCLLAFFVHFGLLKAIK